MFRVLGTLALAAACAPALAENCPPDVRVSFPNFEIAPFVLGTDRVEQPPGLLVEWTRTALTAAGCRESAIVIMRRPPLRQLAEIELGLIDIAPGFAYSAVLAEQLAFPMRGSAPDPGLVIKSDLISLYVRAGDERVKWDGKSLSAPNPRVGTSTGGPATGSISAAYGWTVEMAATPRIDLQKLIAGRVDVILEADVVLEGILQGAEGSAVRKLSPAVLATERYAPVRRGFEQRYPAYTRRFWRELCKQSRRTGSNLAACS